MFFSPRVASNHFALFQIPGTWLVLPAKGGSSVINQLGCARPQYPDPGQS
jgi:hypothetical protein